MKPIDSRHVAGQDHQVGPENLRAILLLDRPEQATRLVEIGVVGPGVGRGETLLPRARAAATVRDAVGTSAMPGHADHQAAVVAEIGRPRRLRNRHQRVQVGDHRAEVERLKAAA